MTDISNHIKAMTELTFSIACDICNNDIQCIYKKLLDSNLDKRTLGFWIWDIPLNKEIYSPRFRESLGYKDENDFPNVPQSWMNAISKEGLKQALDNFTLHITTNGKSQYSHIVTYNKKHFGTVSLLCHGNVAAWQDKKPKIMIGIHLPPDGMLIT